MSIKKCRCGEILSTTLVPNDIQLRVFNDEEWDTMINMGVMDTFDLPDPKYDVWRCPKCERIYVFEPHVATAVKIYALEDG